MTQLPFFGGGTLSEEDYSERAPTTFGEKGDTDAKRLAHAVVQAMEAEA